MNTRDLTPKQEKLLGEMVEAALSFKRTGMACDLIAAVLGVQFKASCFSDSRGVWWEPNKGHAGYIKVIGAFNGPRRHAMPLPKPSGKPGVAMLQKPGGAPKPAPKQMDPDMDYSVPWDED